MAQFKIDQERLLTALTTVINPLVGGGDGSDALQRIVVTASKASVTMQSANGTAEIRVVAGPAVADGDVRLALHGPSLRDLVATLGEGDVTIRAEPSRAHVSADGFDAHLMLFDYAETAEMMQMVDMKAEGVVVDELASAVDMVKHAMPTGDPRPFLNGMVFDQTTADAMRLSASDSVRVADVIVRTAEPDAKAGWRVIVPANSVTTLAKLMAKQKGEPVSIGVTKDSNVLIADIGPIRFATSLVNATYPRVDALLAAGDGTYKVTLACADLESAIKSMAVISDDGDVMSTMTVTDEHAELKHVNDAKERVSCVLRYEGDADAFALTFGMKMLLDAAKAPGVDLVTIRLFQENDAQSRLLVAPSMDEEDAPLYKAAIAVRGGVEAPAGA